MRKDSSSRNSTHKAKRIHLTAECPLRVSLQRKMSTIELREWNHHRWSFFSVPKKIHIALKKKLFGKNWTKFFKIKFPFMQVLSLYMLHACMQLIFFEKKANSDILHANPLQSFHASWENFTKPACKILTKLHKNDCLNSFPLLRLNKVVIALCELSKNGET